MADRVKILKLALPSIIDSITSSTEKSSMHPVSLERFCIFEHPAFIVIGDEDMGND